MLVLLSVLVSALVKNYGGQAGAPLIGNNVGQQNHKGTQNEKFHYRLHSWNTQSSNRTSAPSEIHRSTSRCVQRKKHDICFLFGACFSIAVISGIIKCQIIRPNLLCPPWFDSFVDSRRSFLLCTSLTECN